ncbi:MAG: hypothetical protein F4X54_00935 [Chloroflexi bacterium]|nr:hypothetical protein [Chloroflexota bacterium]MYB83313.1 hypothetical protein [Chloroflexota bacterium]
MSDVVTIHPTDDDYPERVRSVMKSPPILYGIGNGDLLGRDAFGICGSRDASEEALKWAFDFGYKTASEGKVLVSGYAKGVDRQAHAGALSAGGGTVAVLPEGIRWFRVVKQLQELADEENFLALSMFAPEERWQTWRAMERNGLIVALSEELWAVEPGERGGTADAVKKGKSLGKPVHIKQWGGVPAISQMTQPTLL